MLSRFPWFTGYRFRKLEWWLAFYTLYFGGLISLPPTSMAASSYRNALFIMPETAWGMIYATVGAFHVYALHINGRAAWTPFVRLTALFLSANVFFAMARGLMASNPWSTGVLTYMFVAFGFCGAAFYTAALDCGREIKIWRMARGGN